MGFFVRTRDRSRGQEHTAEKRRAAAVRLDHIEMQVMSRHPRPVISELGKNPLELRVIRDAKHPSLSLSTLCPADVNVKRPRKQRRQAFRNLIRGGYQSDF